FRTCSSRYQSHHPLAHLLISKTKDQLFMRDCFVIAALIMSHNSRTAPKPPGLDVFKKASLDTDSSESATIAG
ncbi:MAG: hypothetical protein ACKPAJ_08165, partial [Actinomycetota bacterium]